MASSGFQSVKDYYFHIMSYADPDCDGIIFFDHPDKVLTIVALYLLVVWKGPKWMQHRKPFELQNTIILYNFFCVLLSSYLAIGSFVGIYLAGSYDPLCNEVSYEASLDKSMRRYATVLAWLFFVSKVAELMDTVFFILRKKNNQLTFLHVYHHTSMVLLTWAAIKFMTKNSCISYIPVNCTVHIVMYTYYGMASFGPELRKYLWWKKYITRLQIGQFCILIIQSFTIKIYDCRFSSGTFYMIGFYIFTFLVLFTNFYVKAYLTKPGANKANVHQRNGVEANKEESCNDKDTGRDGEISQNVSNKKQS